MWAPRTSCAQPQDRAELVAALDSTAQAHAADSTVAGAAVAVVHRGDTLLHEGYGQANLEFDVPMPPDAVFEVGSVTKQFTATAILQLAEKDLVSLEASVNEYLPNYDARGHTITIRNLLYHTSGIRDFLWMSHFPALWKDDISRDSLVSVIEAEPLRFTPGSAMIYSNSGYFLLGLIIEEASGQSYGEYLEEHLLKPAGMDASHICNRAEVVKKKAKGYVPHPEKGFAQPLRPPLRPPGPNPHRLIFAAGSLCSTTGDLVRWPRSLHGGQILSDSMYQEMIAPGTLTDGTRLRYAMGLRHHKPDGNRTLSHSGAFGGGFLSHLRYYPEKDLSVVALQNTFGPRPPSVLARTLGRLVLGEGEKPEESTYKGEISELEGQYAGPVGRGEFLTLEVEVKDGILLASEVGSNTKPDRLRYVSGLTWRQGENRYRFVQTGDKTVELRLDEVSSHYVLRRVGDR